MNWFLKKIYYISQQRWLDKHQKPLNIKTIKHIPCLINRLATCTIAHIISQITASHFISFSRKLQDTKPSYQIVYELNVN